MKTLLVLAALVPFALYAPVYAQSPGKKHTSAMQFAKAGATWAEILADKKALQKAIKAGNLGEAHDLVFNIRDNAVTLPYKSEGLTPAKQKQLNQYVQTVAQIATRLDKVADAGKKAETTQEFVKLSKVLIQIEAVYPANALPTLGAKPMTAQERQLFLTPGGLYTQADILANGNTSVYQKFPGYVPQHNADVERGAPVCPISKTKPDPKITWQVAGKAYTFCCPPCVAEFVQNAKEKPTTILAPEAYVKP
jgi:roadblock/LC7 domain-containing protein